VAVKWRCIFYHVQSQRLAKLPRCVLQHCGGLSGLITSVWVTKH